MPFDAASIAIMLSLNVLVQAIGWALVWRAYPRVPGVRAVVLGTAIIVASLILENLQHMLPSSLPEIMAHILNTVGLCLVSLAVAKFFQRPVPGVIMGVLIVAAIFTWPLMHAIEGEGLLHHALVIAAFSAVFAILNAWLGWPRSGGGALMQDFFVAIQLIHAAFSSVRAVDAALQISGRAPLIPPGFDGVWLFESFLYSVGFFLSLITVLMARLGRSLAERNRALRAEADERADLALKFAAALAEEERIRQEQQDFLLMIGHEFRTPLAIIDRAVEMVELKMQGMPEAALAEQGPEITAALARIPAATERLRLLIQCFLAAERLQQGDRPDPVPMKASAFMQMLSDLLPLPEGATPLADPLEAPGSGEPVLRLDPEVLHVSLAYLGCLYRVAGRPIYTVGREPNALRLIINAGTEDPPANGFAIAAWLVESQAGTATIRESAGGWLEVHVVLPLHPAPAPVPADAPKSEPGPLPSVGLTGMASGAR